MKKFALVKNGMVQSTFYTNGVKADYPDIADLLHIVDDNVCDNWTFDGSKYISQDGLTEINEISQVE